MQTNLDCIRDILLVLEDNLQPDSKGKIIPIDVKKLPDYMSLKKYSDTEIYYHVRLLYDYGVLVQGRQFIIDDIPRIANITASGKAMLNKLRPKDAVQKLIPVLAKFLPGKGEEIVKLIIQTDTDQITP